jgi:hypothetical protein
MLFGECEKVVAKSVAAIPAPSAANVGVCPFLGPHISIVFGGEAGHQAKTPVRGRVHSPTTAFFARGHVVEHRVNMDMRSPKIERNPRIGVVPYRLGWSSMS